VSPNPAGTHVPGTLPLVNPFPIDLEVVIAPNDPNIWDIATAVGTVATVAVALVLGLVEQHRSGKRQAAELRRLEEERARAESERNEALGRAEKEEQERQARRIAIWTEPGGRVASGEDGSDQFMRTETLVVQNYSDMPIFYILLVYKNSDGVSEVADSETVLLPGTAIRAQLPEVPFEDERRYSDHDYVMFGDVFGRHWIRTMTGELKQVVERASS